MTKVKHLVLNNFFSTFPSQSFSKNTIILKPGDKVRDLYFVKHGIVRAFSKINSEESTLNLFNPLFLISLMHYFTNQKNNLYLETLTNSDIVVLPSKEIKNIELNNPKIWTILMDYFVSSNLSFLSNQTSVTRGTATSKIASVLAELVQDRGRIKNNQPIVYFPTSHKIIATITGLTRETTSVQMSKLHKSGILSYQRSQFTVKNLRKLNELALQ